MDERQLHRLLRAQDGVISRQQAAEVGLSEDQVEYRLLTGRWLRIYPGVYRLTAVTPSDASSLRAAALWVGDRGTLVGQGAAWWWGIVAPPRRWSFATGQGFALTPQPGLLVSRTLIDPVDSVSHRGIRVTSRPLTVLQTAVELECTRPGSGISLIDRAKQRRWASQADLEAVHQRYRGRRGSAAAGRLLLRTGDRAHSELERAAVSELRAAGITGFVLNFATRVHNGRDVELDVAFVRIRLALELDGFAFHADPRQQREDLQRANDIMAAGWILRRFTWSDVVGDPVGFVRTVRAAVAQAESRRGSRDYPG